MIGAFILYSDFIMYILSFFLLFSICTASLIESINIIGNDHTKNHIILREIHHPIPAKFDTTLANKDRDRIYNLGLFSTVEISQIDSFYTVFVVETFKYLPIPILEYEEGKGFSFGAGIAYLNFRGLNEQLAFGRIGGEETTYFINFINPWVYGDHGSVIASIYQFYSESAIYNYSFQERAVLFGSGFYKREYNKFKSEFGYEIITLKTTSTVSKNYTKKTYVDGDTTHNYIRGMISYEYDTRDIYTDPTQGERLIMKLSPKLGLHSTANRLNLELSYKKYVGLKSWLLDPVISFKSQVLLKFTNDLPIFEYEYLGGEGFVRGYSPVIQVNHEEVQNKIEGVHIIYQNIQLQHTFLERHDYNGIEIGIDLIYFTDFGISSKSLSSFKINNVIIGYGIGVRLFVSGFGVISLDFGFNPYGSWTLHPSDGEY